MPVAYCVNCGFANSEGATVCDLCRQPLPTPEAVSAAAYTCPSCTRATLAEARYCANCGARLGLPSAPQAPAEGTEPRAASERRTDSAEDEKEPLRPPVRRMMLAALIPVVAWEVLHWFWVLAGRQMWWRSAPANPLGPAGQMAALFLESLPWLVFALVLGYIFAWQGIPDFGEAALMGAAGGVVIAALQGLLAMLVLGLLGVALVAGMGPPA